MRRLRHQTQDVEGTRGKHSEVDEHKGNQRRCHGWSSERRHRLRRAQQAVDGERLTADFGRDPSGEHGDETGRPHGKRKAMKPAGLVEPAAPALVKADKAKRHHQQSEPHHDPERPEQDRHIRPVGPCDRVEAGQRRIERVLQDQRRDLGDLDCVAHGRGVLVGDAEQDQRRAVGMALIMPFHGHDLGRLMLQRVDAVLVADEDLDGCHDRDHPHRHGKHDAAFVANRATQEMESRDRTDDQRRGKIGGNDHMDQAIWKGWVEDDFPPVERDELTGVVDAVACRRLHPGIDRDDPERGDCGADSDQTGGREVKRLADAAHAKKHHTQEAGLKEERRHHLIGHQRPDDRSCLVGKDSPVGAELVGHDNPGNDTHAKRNGKYLQPVFEEVQVDAVPCYKPESFENGQIAGQADRESRKDNVERHGEGELCPSQYDRIESVHFLDLSVAPALLISVWLTVI